MIDQIVHEYWESELPRAIPRGISLELKSDLINDIVGIRRSGKTFLMFDTIDRLTGSQGKKSTIYINFENRKLIPLKQEYFNEIIEFIYAEKLLDKHKKIYLFLDEVQRIEGWERLVRSIYDEFKGKIKIFVSGSSQSLLSKEYGKLLTGRHLTTTVTPLSFREFLGFKNVKIDKLTEKNLAEIKALLKEFIQYGGFPEVVLSENKEEILNQLFSDIIAKDILGRGEIRKEQLIEEFAYYLSSNVSNLLSFNKMANYFKSRGIKISVPTLENYFYFMKNAFLFLDTKIFSYNARDQLQYPRKIYCIDNGIVNLTALKFNNDRGRLYENIVAIELLRKMYNEPATGIFYWRDRQQREVDFVTKRGLRIEKLIQVCYNVSDSDIKSRETKSLLKASKELKCNNLIIITEDFEAEEKIEGKIIIYKPLWKWLLGI